MEFSASDLKLHGTKAKEFLKLFSNNGYKISPFSFLDKINYTADYIIEKVKFPNLYITYSKFLEK